MRSGARFDEGEGTTVVDKQAVTSAVTQLILAIGEDPLREGLQGTPRRIAEMYEEIFQGVDEDPRAVLQVGFEEDHQEMVIVRDISFYSLCEHHFMPFFGSFHVGYIPKGRVVGISKLARCVEILARRPQLQERLTSQIADIIMEELDPFGVAVVGHAQHLCMTMRGIRKPGSQVITSANRGVFRDNSVTRAEFMALLGDEHRVV
ncbi:MAG: GTP cyclohydrolase I FolE [Chloroflexi bacterium]|nr:GTP cyclohydrolase I FolE [Chloroflexota bacterium]